MLIIFGAILLAVIMLATLIKVVGALHYFSAKKQLLVIAAFLGFTAINFVLIPVPAINFLVQVIIVSSLLAYRNWNFNKP